MALVKKRITVTDRHERWIRQQVDNGEYGNDSEYVCDLIQRDQELSPQFQALRRAIQEGLESGIGDKSLRDIWAEAEQRYRTNHGRRPSVPAS